VLTGEEEVESGRSNDDLCVAISLATLNHLQL
jgi:hypothetical protein